MSQLGRKRKYSRKYNHLLQEGLSSATLGSSKHPEKRQPQTVAADSIVNVLLAHATQATAKVSTIHHCWPSISVN